MASGNQNRPQGQGRQNGGSSSGAREQIQNLGGQIQEGAAQVGDRLREGYDATREEMARRYRRAEGTIARNPAPSLLISFGVGFGVGLIVTSLLGRREETWADRYLPDSLRKMPDTLRDSAQSLRDSAQSVRDSAPDALHHLADAVASRVSSVLRR